MIYLGLSFLSKYGKYMWKLISNLPLPVPHLTKYINLGTLYNNISDNTANNIFKLPISYMTSEELSPRTYKWTD